MDDAMTCAKVPDTGFRPGDLPVSKTLSCIFLLLDGGRTLTGRNTGDFET